MGDESNAAGAAIEQGTPVMCRYEGGDAEHGVLPEMFDVLQPLGVGDLVTCRYGGGEDAFPGKISSAHADGTYDVAYDDGDSESNVARSLISKRVDNDVADEVECAADIASAEEARRAAE